jgi:hypothetical protein
MKAAAIHSCGAAFLSYLSLSTNGGTIEGSIKSD